jgi:hypothetical protein
VPIWAFILLGLAAVVIALALYVRARFRFYDEQRTRDLARFGLTELDLRMRRETDAGGKPAGTDPRAHVVASILDLLRAYEANPPPPGQVATLRPTTELERIVCAELVRLGRMKANADGTVYALQPPPPRVVN